MYEDCAHAFSTFIGHNQNKMKPSSLRAKMHEIFSENPNDDINNETILKNPFDYKIKIPTPVSDGDFLCIDRDILIISILDLNVHFTNFIFLKLNSKKIQIKNILNEQKNFYERKNRPKIESVFNYDIFRVFLLYPNFKWPLISENEYHCDYCSFSRDFKIFENIFDNIIKFLSSDLEIKSDNCQFPGCNFHSNNHKDIIKHIMKVH